MLSTYFIGLTYTPTENKWCFSDVTNSTGPYDTYGAAKAACDSLPTCNKFYKDDAGKYFTCPLDSFVDDNTGFTLFTLG